MNEKGIFMLAVQISIYNLNENNFEYWNCALRSIGADILLISICEFFDEGEKRTETLERLKTSIAFFEEKGFTVAAWTSSLGYGGERAPSFYEKCTDRHLLTDFSGHTCGSVCTLDEKFTEYMCRNVRDFIRAGAKMILWDDDLVQSVRPGLVCACDEHLKLLSERTGKSFTRKTARELFTGEPLEERTAYIDLMGETLNDFCRKVRKAADELDPKVNMGLCASFTHFDIDGVYLEETLNILAGEGQKPFLRLSGAPYWSCFAPRYPGQNLNAVSEFLKMQYGWYENKGITILDENDCYPHDERLVPVSYVEMYDKISLTLPKLVRHKYILCFDPETSSRSYMKAHIRNMPDDEKIIGMARDMHPAGLRVYQSEHLIRSAELPADYPGDGRMMALFSQPYAGIFAANNSVCTTYSGGGTGIVFGESAKYLTEKELNAGLILDMKAALILEKSGVDTGLLKAEKISSPNAEIFGDVKEYFSEPDGEFCEAYLKDGAEILSFYESGGKKIPACWKYENKSCQRFAVYAFSGESLRGGITGGEPIAAFSPSRQTQLYEIYKFLSGKPLPAFAKGYYGLNIQCLVSSDQSEMTLVMCNMSRDGYYSPEIMLDGEYEIISQLKKDEWAVNSTTLTCEFFPACTYAAVKLRKKENI